MLWYESYCQVSKICFFFFRLFVCFLFLFCLCLLLFFVCLFVCGGVGCVVCCLFVLFFCLFVCFLFFLPVLSLVGKKKCENNKLYPIGLEQMHSLQYIYQKLTKLFLRRKVSKLHDTYTLHFTYYNFISSETRKNKNKLIVKHYVALKQQQCVKQQPYVFRTKSSLTGHEFVWNPVPFSGVCWNKLRRF